MSEYEIASLTNEFLNALQGRIETYLTGLFAMLITSYFAAAKLTRAMAVFVVTLFTMFSIVMLHATLSAGWRVRTLAEMTAGSVEDFPWLWSMPLVRPMLLILLLLVGSYVGAVWFFVHVRRGRDLSGD